MDVNLHNGDCIEYMRGYEDNVFTGVVTDPPYGLGILGKKWDTFDKSQFGRAGSEGENDLKVKKNFNILPRYRTDGLYEFAYEWAVEALRVVKPGGILLSFAGSRTYHKIASAIDDAGWDVIDMMTWVHSQGFPKAHDISKAIDKKFGAEREVIGKKECGYQVSISKLRKEQGHRPNLTNATKEVDITAPATPEAQLWDGYKSQLKPALEPICVAVKPRDGTYVDNALKWGVAGFNIGGAKIPTADAVTINTFDDGSKPFGGGAGHEYTTREETDGRYPSNFLHDGSDEVLNLFPTSKSTRTHNVTRNQRGSDSVFNDSNNGFQNGSTLIEGYDDEGSAARFFYCAKASVSEKNEGLEGIKNTHVSVKPVALMEYLVRLVKPPQGGVILDPFLGSGTTGIACILNDISFAGIENDAESFEIARQRIEYWKNKPKQKGLF